MKTAIVYDWIDKWGGAERLLMQLCELYPDAPVFTSHYDKKRAPWAKNLTIRTSFMQRLPRFITNNRILSLPFYPYAFESFDLSSYDIVISVSSWFAKGVITKPQTTHICYLLTPTRYLWFLPPSYSMQLLPLAIKKKVRNIFKKWDYTAAQRPDAYICISETVRMRLEKFYHREGRIVYPPFDTAYWRQLKLEIDPNDVVKWVKKGEKFFLSVARLERHKGLDRLLQVFSTLNRRLIIVGSGSSYRRFRKALPKNISIIPSLSDGDLAVLYSSATALIIPEEEDFGLTQLEAQFFGCPVIAYGKGGVTESVVNEKTGLFFFSKKTQNVIDILNKYDRIEESLRKKAHYYGPKNVERFDKKIFFKRFSHTVERIIENTFL